MTEFWMDKEEQKFLLSYIKPTHKMLEWGSGNSTVYLQDKVNFLVSVEHHEGWWSEIAEKITNENVHYMLCPPDNPNWEKQYTRIDGTTLQINEKGDDGGFEDFTKYVTAPIAHAAEKKFDIIFIDGRARVACAFASLFYLKKRGKIFIHDFGEEATHPELPYRTYYDSVLNFLDVVDHKKTMYCFKIK